jgi:hypothetical protein
MQDMIGSVDMLVILAGKISSPASTIVAGNVGRSGEVCISSTGARQESDGNHQAALGGDRRSQKS